jgi:chromate reductase
MKTTKILGIVGSLRKASVNKKLMEAFKQAAPEGVTVEIADISMLPLYNEELEANFPEAAKALKAKIREADGIIIATPEYNRSIPGVLKNSIDWTSRPYGDSAWDGKLVVTVGASPGNVGTAVAQSHLKETLVYLNATIVGQPEFYLGGAYGKFGENGALTDAKTKEFVAKLLETFVARIRKQLSF